MPSLRAVGSLSCEELIGRLKAASWDAAMDNLRVEWSEGAEVATERAKEYASHYEGNRASMVFDCVMSRQRQYKARVLPLVGAFGSTASSKSLAALAAQGPPDGGSGRTFPFKRGEANAIRQVAAGLARFCEEHGMDDDAGVFAWAEQARAFERTPKSDPWLGDIKGIGLATFAYLRMRCGADAIKPDVRVRAALGSLLFPLGDGSDFALLCVASAAAEELGVSRLELDQLLWWMETKSA